MRTQSDPEIYKSENLLLRIIAMPRDTNYRGDIFGGWTVSQMDLAAGICGCKYTHNKVVTAAINNIQFNAPIFVGDEVSIYGKVMKAGKTSVTIVLEVWVERRITREVLYTNSGEFICVSIDEQRKPKQFAASPEAN